METYEKNTYMDNLLTLKAPSKVCSRRHSKIFIFYFSEKTSLDISCELSAWQTIHMKCQDLFSSENNKKKSKLLSALVVIAALRVKYLLPLQILRTERLVLLYPEKNGMYNKWKYIEISVDNSLI